MMKALALFLALVIAGFGVIFAWWKRSAGAVSGDARRVEETEDADGAGGASAPGVPAALAGERPTPPELTSPLGVSFTRIMRWVDGLQPQLVSVIPNAIPTSYRGRVEMFTRSNGTFVCQHLPHPGGKDYLLYPLEEMPLSQEELKRAERMRATVVVTLQNGRVIEAKIPRGQEWGRGLWQQRSGWYRGGR